MSSQYTQLVEKINRIVRDRGDVELMVLLDKIVDKETEAEQAEALGAVVKILNHGKKTSTPATTSLTPATFSTSNSVDPTSQTAHVPAIKSLEQTSVSSQKTEEEN